MTAPLTLRQLATLLQGCLDAGADPELPVALCVDNDQVGYVTTVGTTTVDDCDTWIGGESDE